MMVGGDVLEGGGGPAGEQGAGYLDGELIGVPGELRVEEEHEMAFGVVAFLVRNWLLESKFLPQEPAHAIDGCGIDDRLSSGEEGEG
jgi:hypothetical protein